MLSNYVCLCSFCCGCRFVLYVTFNERILYVFCLMPTRVIDWKIKKVLYSINADLDVGKGGGGAIAYHQNFDHFIAYDKIFAKLFIYLYQ